ncbi:hypothetical protein [Roseivirga sp. E12]|nr:hypothetical protein [Roseivirga sp. E12]MBO3697690.1 hypothetical protein [Roseivirga sp. E12]
MNCETSYTDCCQIETIKTNHGAKVRLNLLTDYLRSIVITGAEDMSKIK